VGSEEEALISRNCDKVGKMTTKKGEET